MRASHHLHALLAVAALAVAPAIAAGAATAADAVDLAKAAEAGLNLPQDLAQMRLIAVLRDGSLLRFDAIPAVGGPEPRAETATAFACQTPGLSALIAAGGRVEVALLGRPLAEIDKCPPAP